MPINKSDIDKTTEIIDRLMFLLGLKLRTTVSADLEGLKVNFSGKDSAMLIGYRGENLNAFSHILRAIIRKSLGKDILVRIDVDQYLVKKEEKVKRTVRKAILKVKETSEPEELEGLTSYERRIAHMVVEKEGLLSESITKNNERILIVKPRRTDV